MSANIKIDVRGPNGESQVTVQPGGSVNYRIVGELSNDPNLGLALIGFSLDFTGGNIDQPANEPTTNPMYNFDYDEIDAGHKEGLTNPIGFGGTLLADPNHGGRTVIAQTGGCQNTIKNTAGNADFPIGTVITNVAVFGSPVVIATGSFTLPGTAQAGQSYQLNAFDVFANVIKAGETGDVYYATEIAGVGTITNLTVSVGDVLVNFASSIPAFTTAGNATVPPGGSLWRSSGNVIRLTFDSALPGLPGAGQLLIQELQPSGAFGPDLSASFAATLDSGNKVLRLRDGLTATPTATFGHRKWYAVRNTGGWTGVANFEAQFPSQVGDATGDNRTLQGDILEVNSGIPCLSNCGDQNRKDVTGDGRILQSDILETNTRISSLPVGKPSGH